jgi:hypothetical protein
MKFELTPYNSGLSDDVLMDDLRSVAQKLGKEYVTKDEYNQHGRLSASGLQKRFGSWCKAHELAGLRKIRHFDTTAEDCIADLKLVAAKLGTKVLAFNDYKPHGRYNIALIARRCGSFKGALELAGLSRSPKAHDALTHEQLFENLEQLWEALGRQPTKEDYTKPLSRYSYGPYVRRFGSYRAALESFVASFSAEATSKPNGIDQLISCDVRQSVAPTRHTTSRNVSWRLRFLVMRRDSFKCRLCGVSPALKPGTVLVVDHVEPWASGGETEFGNLQTLCQVCNGGKSDLALTTDG